MRRGGPTTAVASLPHHPHHPAPPTPRPAGADPHGAGGARAARATQGDIEVTEATLIPVDIAAVVDRIVAVIESVPETRRNEVMSELLDRLECCRTCGSIRAGARCCYDSRPDD